jgi:hypothetical protein
MTVILHRRPFSKEEREILIESVMTGSYSEFEDLAIEIAEHLPDLLRKANLPDTSDNRRKLIELVMVRWSMPKGPQRSRSYRRMARR